MNIIADERTVFTSPDAICVFCYTPALCHGLNGRLVASFDLGGTGVGALPGPRTTLYGDWSAGNQLRTLVSDDHGATWRETARLAMFHALLFKDNGVIYLLGTDGRLVISASHDNGETFSAPAVIEGSRRWEQGGGRMDFHNGRITICYEYSLENNTWPDVGLCLLSANSGDDLTRPEAWSFSEPFDPRPLVANAASSIGIPFFTSGPTVPDSPRDKRRAHDPGILESNVVRIRNPHHNFYDPEDHSVLVFLRVSNSIGNLGAVVGARWDGRRWQLAPLKTPSGATLFYVPLPGGQMKFFMEYDEKSRLYWLISTLCTDSLTRPECLPDDRYNLPDNERNTIALYYSKDAFNWLPAGLVAKGPTARQSRHYANLLIDGDDLLVFSRSGDEHAVSAHNGNLLTLHRVRNFRALATT